MSNGEPVVWTKKTTSSGRYITIPVIFLRLFKCTAFFGRSFLFDLVYKYVNINTLLYFVHLFRSSIFWLVPVDFSLALSYCFNKDWLIDSKKSWSITSIN